jgi:hypothetical protein
MENKNEYEYEYWCPLKCNTTKTVCTECLKCTHCGTITSTHSIYHCSRLSCPATSVIRKQFNDGIPFYDENNVLITDIDSFMIKEMSKTNKDENEDKDEDENK